MGLIPMAAGNFVLGPMTQTPSGGSLDFCTKDTLARYIYSGSKIAYLTIPPDSDITILHRDAYITNKYIVDRIITVEEFMKDFETAIDMIAKVPYLLQYVEDQTDEMCLFAVSKSGAALPHVKKQTPEICLEAMKTYGAGLVHVIDQTEEICIAAIKHDILSFLHIKQVTPKIRSEASKCGVDLPLNKKLTVDVCLDIVKKSKNLSKFRPGLHK